MSFPVHVPSIIYHSELTLSRLDSDLDLSADPVVTLQHLANVWHLYITNVSHEPSINSLNQLLDFLFSLVRTCSV